MIIDAILKINPSAKVSVSGSDINTCEIEFHNGTAEISRADIKAMIPTVKQEIKDAETAVANNKISATNKLKALGLTDDEIGALKI